MYLLPHDSLFSFLQFIATPFCPQVGQAVDVAADKLGSVVGDGRAAVADGMAGVQQAAEAAADQAAGAVGRLRDAAAAAAKGGKAALASAADKAAAASDKLNAAMSEVAAGGSPKAVQEALAAAQAAAKELADQAARDSSWRATPNERAAVDAAKAAVAALGDAVSRAQGAAAALPEAAAAIADAAKAEVGGLAATFDSALMVSLLSPVSETQIVLLKIMHAPQGFFPVPSNSFSPRRCALTGGKGRGSCCQDAG
jgi:hypothetical protein